MTTTKIDPPAFADAVAELTDLALIYPEHHTPHAYTSISAHDGSRRAHDLIAHAYAAQGGSLEAFAGNRTDSRLPNPSAINSVRLPIAWDYIYTQPAIFLGLREDEQKAKDLMVYWLYGRVQIATDELPWKPALLKALRYVRRLILHKNSGFLVQTHGEHDHLVAPAIAAIDEALARLK